MKRFTMFFAVMMLGVLAGGAVQSYAITSAKVNPLDYVSITKPLEEKVMTLQEQLDAGYKYNKYTGERISKRDAEEELSPTEKRFRDLEDRVSKLERKN